MRRPSRILFRLAVAVFVLLLLLVVAFLLVPDRALQPPPLPFNTNGYFVTRSYNFFPPPPPNAPPMRRFWYACFKFSQKLHPYQMNPTNTTFAAMPVGLCSISGFLNQCTQASDMHYFMPSNIAAGVVYFGSPIALNGRQWIDAFENVLQTDGPSLYDPLSKTRLQQNLVLIRYPKQKAVLVLTSSDAWAFRQTNNTGAIDQPKP
jgi:hypothetical protein